MDTQLVMRAIGVSHTACKDEFRRNLLSYSWSVVSFFLILMFPTVARPTAKSNQSSSIRYSKGSKMGHGKWILRGCHKLLALVLLNTALSVSAFLL